MIMRNSILPFVFSLVLGLGTVTAQNQTKVTAQTSDISDNLDLRAVASLFGDSENLEVFEKSLNNPETPISNLDLNNDNYVDYLRVIESVENNAHLIVIQAVLYKDIYQDVATIEVEKDRNNKVQIQVVGNDYIYGQNYIYEPVYVYQPVIYNHFFRSYYSPYCSSFYYGYYPSYFSFYRPFPVFRYRNHIAMHINFGHHYNYVNVRNCYIASGLYYGRRNNGYATLYPNRSFTNRNNGFTNRRELTTSRGGDRVVSTNNARGNIRSNSSVRNTNSRSTTSTSANRPTATRGTSRSTVNSARGTSRSVTTTRPTSTRSNSVSTVRKTSTRSSNTRSISKPSSTRSVATPIRSATSSRNVSTTSSRRPTNVASRTSTKSSGSTARTSSRRF